MSRRAEALADRLEQGAQALAVLAESLSDAEWRMNVPKDGRPVGVIGMCMSGGFALAMIPFSPVSAAVLSQPALPFVLAPWRSDLGLSAADLAELRARVGAGECVRAMRFSRDRISPRKRMRLLQRVLPAAECVEIETSDPRLHSVLGRAVDRTLTGRLGKDVQRALDDTIAFLDRHLKADA